MITTNIEAVQWRLRKFEADLHKALLAAVAPKSWLNALRETAKATLIKQWQMERDVVLRAAYEQLSPRIVETITGELYDNGSWFTMTVPEAALAVWPELTRAAAFNASLFTPTGRVPKATKEGNFEDLVLRHANDMENLEHVRQTIRDWVAVEKERTPERDFHADGTPLSNEEISQRIMDIMGVGERPLPREGKMDEATKDLAGAIQEWLAGEGRHSTPEDAAAQRVADGEAPATPMAARPPIPTMDPAVVRGWLEAVLAAWVKVVHERLPLRIEHEVRKMRKSKV